MVVKWEVIRSKIATERDKRIFALQSKSPIFKIENYVNYDLLVKVEYEQNEILKKYLIELDLTYEEKEFRNEKLVEDIRKFVELRHRALMAAGWEGYSCLGLFGEFSI